MSLRLIKRFRNPAFTDAEWSNKNPYLYGGEFGIVIENNIAIGVKVGPGFWNDLDLIFEDKYNFDEEISNPIGDASGNLNGERIIDVVHKMLNPYGVPVITNLKNNAGGAYYNESVIEIGASLSGNVRLTYDVSNQGNLSGGTPMSVDANGIFNNEGNFAVGPIVLTLGSPITANSNNVTEYTITLSANHTNGSEESTTKIKFHPRIMWAVGQSETLVNGAAFMALNRSSLITNDYKRDYNFAGTGYSWLAIPDSLSPSNVMFSERTNPDLPGGYSMEDMGLMSINNGVGTYSYRMYRSTYYLNAATKLKVS